MPNFQLTTPTWNAPNNSSSNALYASAREMQNKALDSLSGIHENFLQRRQDILDKDLLKEAMLITDPGEQAQAIYGSNPWTQNDKYYQPTNLVSINSPTGTNGENTNSSAGSSSVNSSNFLGDTSTGSPARRLNLTNASADAIARLKNLNDANEKARQANLAWQQEQDDRVYNQNVRKLTAERMYLVDERNAAANSEDLGRYNKACAALADFDKKAGDLGFLLNIETAQLQSTRRGQNMSLAAARAGLDHQDQIKYGMYELITQKFILPDPDNPGRYILNPEIVFENLTPRQQLAYIDYVNNPTALDNLRNGRIGLQEPDNSNGADTHTQPVQLNIYHKTTDAVPQ